MLAKLGIKLPVGSPKYVSPDISKYSSGGKEVGSPTSLPSIVKKRQLAAIEEAFDEKGNAVEKDKTDGSGPL
jgi:hypothetical protein